MSSFTVHTKRGVHVCMLALVRDGRIESDSRFHVGLPWAEGRILTQKRRRTNTDGVTSVLAHSRTGSLPSPQSHRGGHCVRPTLMEGVTRFPSSRPSHRTRVVGRRQRAAQREDAHRR